jgi:quercetin dioxygenase-like cupin family protein
MKIVNYAQATPHKFEAETVKGVTGRIAIGGEDGAGNFCMRVFELEPGGYTPRHSHDWEHEIFVHEGKGEVWTGAGWEALAAGTVLFIPGTEKHQIRNTGNGKFVFVCLIPAGPPEL